MGHKIEDQVKGEIERLDFDLCNRISSDSLTLAIAEVYAKQKSQTLKTPEKLKYIKGRFGDVYIQRRVDLLAKCNIEEGSRKVANEYEIAALRSRNWWKLSIEAGVLLDNDYTRQFTTEEYWWRDYKSKAYAFYDHVHSNEIAKRLRLSFAECNTDAELTDLVFNIYSINALADIDERAGSMSKHELLDEIFEFFDMEALAQFSDGWNKSSEMIKQDISAERARHALMRLEKDPISKAKQSAKMAIKGEWEKIPKGKKTYGWKSEFARNMGAKHPIIKDVSGIRNWVDEWEKLLVS